MQNQTEAVPTLRDPLGHERGTQPPNCCLFSTIHCGFISLPLPVSWYAGSRFLALTGWLLFADEWIIFHECWITLSAVQGKQEAWLIDALYSPSPSGFHAAALQEGIFEPAEEWAIEIQCYTRETLLPVRNRKGRQETYCRATRLKNQCPISWITPPDLPCQIPY